MTRYKSCLTALGGFDLSRAGGRGNQKVRSARPAGERWNPRAELSDDLLSFDTTLPTSCPGLSAGRTLKEMMFRMSKQLKYIIVLLFMVTLAGSDGPRAIDIC